MPGEEVVVYNERFKNAKRRSEIESGNWFVNRYVGGPLFEVINEDTGEKEIKSRYQLHQKGKRIIPF